MSIEAMRAVWKHSESRGTDRMVMTLIANSANPEGWGSYQFQETIAEGANTSLRTVERSVEKAIAAGELEVHRPDRTKQCHYSVMLPGLAIHDDPDERVRRDEHYEQLALGRAEKTRQTRQKRRSEDPSPVSGPGAEGPDSHDGSDPTGVTGPDPTPASGAHPSPVSGLKEETSLNTFETPEKELALAAEELWACYPHGRRNLDPARTLDHLRALEVDDAASIERLARALAEDIHSRDWIEGFGPSLSNWLKNRMWDRPLRPLAEVTELNPLAGVEASGPDPELERIFRRDVSEDVWDIWFTQCWHGRRGDTYILGAGDRACSWIELRYRRVIEEIAQRCGYDGLDLLRAEHPPAPAQPLKETAA